MNEFPGEDEIRVAVSQGIDAFWKSIEVKFPGCGPAGAEPLFMAAADMQLLMLTHDWLRKNHPAGGSEPDMPNWVFKSGAATVGALLDDFKGKFPDFPDLPDLRDLPGFPQAS